MNFYVCVECGQRQHSLIKQLQEENYCLEECSSCGHTADKYLEFEYNLKTLQVILCKPQIYRHLFFNLDSIANIQFRSLVYTMIYLTMLYWYENRLANADLMAEFVST